ncbi:MAG: hypothetical protein EZS28_015850 [Streblomastix strix]|uniref:non-specific serine/threonine protein kinase n=1 Tax=Streblomastix strix TaxID=222440 RepID=A0A5J4W2D4_9EUKA|nr:MAG: hypothetical protein EZS28_015850 [Streblomastix strix]
MTEASDIWALAVIMIECLTGDHPYEGQTLDQAVQNIKCGRFRILSDYVNGELKDMILAMLNVYPLKRPSASELLDSDFMLLIKRFVSEKKQKEKLIEEKEKEIQKTKIAEIQIQQVEQEKKLLNDELKLLRIPCSVLQRIAEDLKKPLDGTEGTFDGKKDDFGKKHIIQAGIVDGFNLIFQTRELDQISRLSSLAFYQLANPFRNEIGLLLFKQKPYPEYGET